MTPTSGAGTVSVSPHALKLIPDRCLSCEDSIAAPEPRPHSPMQAGCSSSLHAEVLRSARYVANYIEKISGRKVGRRRGRGDDCERT